MKVYFRTLLVLVLFIFLCVPVFASTKEKAKKIKEVEPVQIQYQAEDKFQIVGDLYLPNKMKKNIKIPLIVLVHALSENKSIWKPYARELVEKGYSVLAVDIRGHGESILNHKKKKSYWRRFKGNEWQYAVSDVVNGIDFLKQNNPQVNTDQIIVVGASIGTCIAVRVGEKLKKDVKGLVLISPFANYKGIEARVPLVNYGPHPILIMVSKSDIKSYADSKELIKYSQGAHQTVLAKNAGHGIFMLQYEPKLKTILYEWIEQNFPPTVEEIPKESKQSKSKKSNSSKEHH